VQPLSTSPDSALERAIWRVLTLGLSLACVFPIFRVQYLPIQDLPQHLAAVRVLHDFDDPLLRFSEFFELQLLRTQYLTVYLATHLLAYVLDLELAMRIVIALVLLSVPWSLATLLRAIGKDERFAILAFPLAYNAHFLLGFLNFIAAISLAFYGLALAVQIREREQAGVPTGHQALWLGVTAIACFYAHVVPFALLGLGVLLVSLERDFLAVARRLLPLVPCAAASLFWLQTSAAGQATLAAAQGAAHGKRIEHTPAAEAIRQLPMWMTDILTREDDGLLLRVWLGIMLFALVCSCFPLARRDTGATVLARLLGKHLLLLAPLCAVLYFVTPTSYDWIWPIAQRFPLLAALFAIVWIAPLKRSLSHAILLAAFLCSAASFHHAGSSFGMFSRLEVGDFDHALAAIPPGQRVAGLIYGRGSRNVAFSPFIHFVGYYQARKGGAVMFTFADFPQSPFRFREDNRPPRVPPRWEWTPERVRVKDLAWYDYVLVRGQARQMQRPDSGFTAVYRGAPWSVWKRTAPSADAR
jgi:hypothetical protein